VALGDRGAGAVARGVAVVWEIRGGAPREFDAASPDHGHVAVEIHHGELAVRSGGRAWVVGVVAELAVPPDRAVGRSTPVYGAPSRPAPATFVGVFRRKEKRIGTVRLRSENALDDRPVFPLGTVLRPRNSADTFRPGKRWPLTTA
jgi:hypothetical protein